MNTNSLSSQKYKKKQIVVEFACNVFSMSGNKAFKGRIPVSGILFIRESQSSSQSWFGTIVSALPCQSTEVSEWKAPGVHDDTGSFDGPYLSALKLKVSPNERLRINPFFDRVNQDVLKANFAPVPDSSANMSNSDISADIFCITGISYRPLKKVDPSTKWFEFRNWREKQLQPISSTGSFTSFSVKVEKGSLISFWGAPILTVDGKVKSIVVYQQNIDDETVTIVGMDIASFIDTMPSLCLSQGLI